MGSSPGQVAPIVAQPADIGKQNLDLKEIVKNDPKLTDIMSKVASGQMSYKDALSAAQNGSYGGGPAGGSDQLQLANSALSSATGGAFGSSSVDPYAASRVQLNDQLQKATAARDRLNMPGISALANGNNELTTAQNLVTSIQNQLNSMPSASQIQNGAGKVAGDLLFTDPRTGSIIASQQVQDNPLTKGLFGQGGIQDQAQASYGKLGNQYQQDRQNLFGGGQEFGLTPEDLQAYNQAAAGITRQFGQSGNNLAEALSSRGLASAPNGVAGQQFSGLMGNQNEQLASAQLQIAQQRIQTAQQLAQARIGATMQSQNMNNSMISGLGTLGAQEQQNQYARNTGGVEHDYNTSMGTNNADLQAWSANQNAINEAIASANQSSKGGSGAGAGAAIGGAVGSIFGPLGTALGTALGGATGSAVK